MIGVTSKNSPATWPTISDQTFVVVTMDGFDSASASFPSDTEVPQPDSATVVSTAAITAHALVVFVFMLLA